jgi:hypothetical protein
MASPSRNDASRAARGDGQRVRSAIAADRSTLHGSHSLGAPASPPFWIPFWVGAPMKSVNAMNSVITSATHLQEVEQ